MTIEVLRTSDAAFIYELERDDGYVHRWTVAVMRLRRSPNGNYELLFYSLLEKKKGISRKVFKDIVDAQDAMKRLVFAYAV